MAARQPLALVGGAYEAYSTGDDVQFNSLGVGRPATGTGGDIRSWGSTVSTFWWTTGNTPTDPTRAFWAQLDNTGNEVSFSGNYKFLSPLKVPDGSLSAPSVLFAGETNTGLRLASLGNLRAVVAGSDAANFLNNGGNGRMDTGLLVATTLAGGTIAGRTNASALTIQGGAVGTLQGLVFDTSAVHSATSGAQMGARFNYNFAPTSGTATFYGVNLDLIINQTGGASGDYAALRVAVTETAAGGVNKLLADFLVGGASKFNVASSGLVTVAGRITGVSAPTAASDAVRADEAATSNFNGYIGMVQAASSTFYTALSARSTTSGAIGFVATHACIVRNLRVYARVAPGGSAVVFTAMKNDAAETGMVVTYDTTDGGVQLQDTPANTVSLAAGDRFSLRDVTDVSYTPNSMLDVWWSADVTRI